MKFRVLLSLLFIIATTFTALHELKHIEHHDSSTCQVCIVDNHSVSADVVSNFKDIVLFSFEQISAQILVSNFSVKYHTNQSRAPPKIS
ncbi:hypothetical protein KKC15_11050 [bacterium]|nr:hypothetical protein [bacterium]